MSDYDFRPSGSLKLKGVAEGGIVKKKKKKSKSKATEIESGAVSDLIEQAANPSRSNPGSGSSTPAVRNSETKKTDAERRFEEVQKRRLERRIAKVAHKTHKERVSELNAHLESLSEHHDIPKVGPG
ncbi:unnamed protein product [Mycena citricolor]|uniref:DUF1754-domain-containing protein n=1 Tax=Mycena citricolor TaxID=2018698 RepID=A0AAD2JVS5_9AGAR|nr:unnamed protein product [Mycena citricolor]